MYTFAEKAKASKPGDFARSPFPYSAASEGKLRTDATGHFGDQAAWRRFQAKKEEHKTTPPSVASFRFAQDFSRIPIHGRGNGSRQSKPTNSAPRIVHEVVRSPGRPLDPASRKWMESRLGHDFGRVRVHTDSLAGKAARSVGAQAYTVGHHIVFGTGRYRPRSNAGRHLIAHELAHVAQQTTGDARHANVVNRRTVRKDPSQRPLQDYQPGSARNQSNTKYESGLHCDWADCLLCLPIARRFVQDIGQIPPYACWDMRWRIVSLTKSLCNRQSHGKSGSGAPYTFICKGRAVTQCPDKSGTRTFEFAVLHSKPNSERFVAWTSFAKCDYRRECDDDKPTLVKDGCWKR
jgi:hypothetical protein